MKSALLVIDVQTGLLLGSPPIYQRKALLATIQRLIARARRQRVPVVFIQDDEVDVPGSPGWDIHPSVTPLAADLRIRKLACDAFHDTGLHRALSKLKVRRVVIVGCKTQYCVDTTARRAASLGYEVTLVADGHSTAGTKVLSAARIIAHHNQLLEGFGAGRREIRVRRASAVTL